MSSSHPLADIVKLTAVFMLIVLACASVTVASCGDGRDLSTGDKALIGHWTYEGDESAEIYFAADGRYTEVGRDGAYSGTWQAMESGRGGAVIDMGRKPTNAVNPRMTVVVVIGKAGLTAEMARAGESAPFATLKYVDSKQKPS